MMETNNAKQNRSSAGVVRFLLPLAVGLVLGAFLYSRFAGTPSQLQSSAVATTPEKQEEAAVPNTTQITPKAQKEVGVAIEPANLRSMHGTLSATGSVCEDPGKVAHIRPLARGLVEKVYARLGDRVTVGAPLIEYDNMELGIAVGEFVSAQAELQQSLTDLEVKKKILDRSREMLKAGALAQTTFDLRQAEYQDAEAKTAAAKAAANKIEEQIHRYGWTDDDLAKVPAKQGHNITHTVLSAPISGIVTMANPHAAIGEVVEPSAEFYVITDMSSLWVLADVFEKDLAHIKPGKAVQVSVAAYPERVFPGRITYVADFIEPKTRTAKVRCLVQNGDGQLKLEMFATIEIPMEATQPMLAVPDSAIQQIDGKPVVFVRTSEKEFRKCDVQTGLSSGGYTEIRAGLKPGEPVVTQGSFVVKTAFLKNLIGERN
jgi:membrane fusion protein, heavy metal efflux system